MFKYITNFIFPKNCFGCGKEGSYICTECLKHKAIIRWEVSCHVCNRPIKLGLVHSECRGKTYLDGVFAVFVYDSLIKTLVLEVKYQYSYDIFNELGIFMARFFTLFPNLSDVILLPVPLFRHKRNLRGFNQAEVLAQKIASRNSLVMLKLLKRVKNTKTQVGMKKHEREVNLKEAFELDKKILIKLYTQTEYSFVLVDDVYTTGTTLNECAKVLKAHFKSAKVYGFCLARAPGGSME